VWALRAIHAKRRHHRDAERRDGGERGQARSAPSSPATTAAAAARKAVPRESQNRRVRPRLRRRMLVAQASRSRIWSSSASSGESPRGSGSAVGGGEVSSAPSCSNCARGSPAQPEASRSSSPGWTGCPARDLLARGLRVGRPAASRSRARCRR
jgi:hypothetical protein